MVSDSSMPHVARGCGCLIMIIDFSGAVGRENKGGEKWKSVRCAKRSLGRWLDEVLALNERQKFAGCRVASATSNRTRPGRRATGRA